MIEETACDECGGLGKTLRGGRLVHCLWCSGSGRVEAFMVRDWTAIMCDQPERFEPYLLPVPKEARMPQAEADVFDYPELLDA